MLELRTFGGLSITADGAFGTGAALQRKTLALLGLLAAAKHGVSRDKLIAYLWPERDTEHGRSLLKQACYALRRDLHQHDLFLGATELRLNPTVITSDVRRFTDAVERGDHAAAAALYRGPFLDGFFLTQADDFERWVETERARLAAQVSDAMIALARDASAGGRHEAAADYWRHLARIDPFSTRAALGVMQALEDAGERLEAIQWGEAYQARVCEELGVEPGAEVLAFIEELRKQKSLTAAISSFVAVRSSSFPPSLRRRIRPAAVGVLLLAGLFAIGSRFAFTHSPNIDVIAVAPFEVFGRLQEPIWGEGVARFLSVKLDGIGTLRTVPASIIARQWHSRADRDGGVLFGRRVGSEFVVVGTVTADGIDSVIVNAILIDAVRGTSLGEVVSRGSIQYIDRLADSLAIGLLRALAPVRPIRAVRLATTGSAAYPALKAFLQGERFYRRGEMDSAYRYYDRALTIDKDFGLALNRRGRASVWIRSWDDSSATADLLRAATLTRGLGLRDSLLLVAQASDASLRASDLSEDKRYELASKLLTLLNSATLRYPQDAEFWYETGIARLFYETEKPRATYAHALDAFDRAIALDSAFAPEYLLPIELAFDLADSARALRYARAYLAQGPSGSDAQATELMIRLVRASPDRGEFLDSALRAASPDVLFRLMTTLHRWPDKAETVIRAARAAVANPNPMSQAPECDGNCRRVTMLAALLNFRGHLKEAHSILGMPIANRAEVASDFILLGAIPSETISALGVRYRPKPYQPLMGLLWWWSKEGDTASLTRYSRQADSLAVLSRSSALSAYWRYHARVARAYISLSTRDSIIALQQFEALPDSVCPWCTLPRLQRVQLLAATGRLRDADLQLVEGERGFFYPSEVLLILERGRISEKLGERERAARAYRYVTDVWAHADSTLRPVVEEARAGLRRVEQ